MSISKSLLRTIFGIALGLFATLAVFGLVLSLLWAIGFQSPSVKLISLFISSALALVSGGFIVAWLAGSSSLTLAGGFGFLFGGISSAYILGPSVHALSFAAVSALMAALGALIFQYAVNGVSSQADSNIS